jgi:hypothetical protein
MPTFASHSHSERIFPDQVRLLYAGAIEAYIATAVNVVLLAAIQWDRIPPLMIIGWLLYMFAVTASRALLVWTYWRSENRVPRAPLWINTICSEVAWRAQAGEVPVSFYIRQTRSRNRYFLRLSLVAWPRVVWPS